MMMPAVHHHFVVCLVMLRGQVVVFRSIHFCCKNDKMDAKTNKKTNEGKKDMVVVLVEDRKGREKREGS